MIPVFASGMQRARVPEDERRCLEGENRGQKLRKIQRKNVNEGVEDEKIFQKPDKIILTSTCGEIVS